MIWIEIRCERRSSRCWSHVNDGPMGASSADSLVGVAELLRRLAAQGRSSGWKRFAGEGWVCPECVANDREN